jgi:hypothetical protein
MTKQYINKLYQTIGEFIVCFQFMEDQIRNIGWIINDPERKRWPPTILRKETNQQLLDKVYRMFCIESEKWNGKNTSFGKSESFKNVIERAHDMRRYRNELIHAAYMELKGGGEIFGLIKSNLNKVKTKSVAKGESELLTISSINTKMKAMALISFDLNLFYTQLVHSFGSVWQT